MEPVFSERDIAARLYQTALDRAREKGFRFGDGADNAIHQFAQDAVAKIEVEERRSGSSREALVVQSQAAFVRLVDEMIAAADQIEGYKLQHPDVIGEQTLGTAMNRLCPFFPIC